MLFRQRLPGTDASLRRQLLITAGGTLALALLSRSLALLTSVLLARWLGVEGYGIYVTATALVLLLTVPTGLGLPVLIVRLLASYRVQQQWGLMRGLLTRANQIVLGASLAMAAVTIAASIAMSSRLGHSEVVTVCLATLLIPLMALGATRAAALRGLHHVVRGQAPENLVMPVLLLIFLASWHFLVGTHADFAPEHAVAARLLATIIAFLIGSWWLLRRIPAEVASAEPRYEQRQWLKSSMPLLLIAGVNVLMVQTDILMLAAISGADSAGVYQAATRGADLVSFSAVIVSMAIQPSIAKLYAAGQLQQLQYAVTQVARAAVVVALPLAAVMIFYGQPLIELVFGESFGRGSIALAILSVAQIAGAATGPAADLLNMTGHERDAMKATIAGALANIALNAVLIPLWDIAGAAVATGLSMLMWNVILAIQAQRRVGINSFAIRARRALGAERRLR